MVLEPFLLGCLLNILERFKVVKLKYFRVGWETIHRILPHPRTGEFILPACVCKQRRAGWLGYHRHLVSWILNDKGSILMRLNHKNLSVCYKRAKWLQNCDSTRYLVRCTACRHFRVLNCFLLLTLQYLNSLKRQASTFL